MEKIPVNIDHSVCRECGICVLECPHHQTRQGHKHVNHEYEYCDRCLHCYSVCPNQAISVEGYVNTTSRKRLEPDTLLAHFAHRRSYRQFIDKALSKKDIDQLIDAARFIPSGGNDHRINIEVLISKEKRLELRAAIAVYYSKILKLLKNPLLRAIAKRIGDPKVKATLNDPFNYRKILYAIEQINHEDDAVFYHAPAVFFFHTDRIMPTAKEDCILSAYNMVLMSETLGLGSCFVSLSQQAVTNDKNCKRILAIPRSHRVEAVVVVGHPKRIYQRPATRPPKQTRFV